MPRLAFLFLGGAHQVLHTAPVAAELSTDVRLEITCFYASEAERAMLYRVLNLWPAQRCKVVPLTVPRAAGWMAGRQRFASALKIPLLLANRRRLGDFDAVVTAERTSTLLKRLSPAVRLIHIPHGAGDRARGFEPRLRWFDLVLVSGRKDAARMIDAGLVDASRCLVSGSIKLGAIARMQAQRPRLFANDRPVVFYNPHFCPTLSSWPRQGKAVLDWFAGQDEFNLIFAPHIRLFQSASRKTRDGLQAAAIPDKILVDPGSERSCDMTYTFAADIYLGDVSSQVYEFISTPRPCVFLDAHATTWEHDPNYACWHFGEVVRTLPDLAQALRQARVRHPEYAARQADSWAAAMDAESADAPALAADHIQDFLQGQAVRVKPTRAVQPAAGAVEPMVLEST